MTYPFVYNGKAIGSLSVTQEGLFTVFSLEAQLHTDKLIRVSVYGENRECYLGIARQELEGIYLHKKLSRAEMKGMPEKIKYASLSGSALPPVIAPGSGEKSDREEGLVWQRLSDGSLITSDEKGHILALPARLSRSVSGVEIKIIAGNSYMLFRY